MTSWLRISADDEFADSISVQPKRWSRRDESESTLQGEASYRNFSRKFAFPSRPGSSHARRSSEDGSTPERTGRPNTRNALLENQGCHEGSPDVSTTLPLKSVVIPFLVVLIPNLAIPAVLLVLVYVHKYRSELGFFSQNEESSPWYPGYILVKLSVTRLAIITSCASTIAPFLTALIMSLWKFRAVRNLQQRTVSGDLDRAELSQIPRLSLLISLLAGSIDGVFGYVGHCFSKCSPKHKSRPGTPLTRPVHSAGLVLCCCTLLVLSMWAADTVFHTFSEAVSVTEITIPATKSAFGHRLVESCVDFNRSANSCLPCTQDLNEDELEFWERRNNVYRLRSNISEVSQMQSIASDLSILLPHPSRVPNSTEYSATTLGVSMRCRPITNTCKPRYLDELPNLTVFNCSDEFRGVIAQVPVVPLNISFTILDPDTPPLTIKTSAYLQFGFYRGADLSVAYNPVNYNVSEPGWAFYFGDSSTTTCPSDDDLQSPAYMGVAGRFSVYYAKAGNNFKNDPGLFTSPTYMDFMFGCSIEAYDVNYVWVHGRVVSYTSKPTNGSVLNMYIGALQYYGPAPADDVLPLVNRMALEENSTAMADTWATLFATRILGMIGGYTRTSETELEQTRQDIIVSRVHIGGLAFVVSCGAAYAMLVSAIALSALVSAHYEPRLYAHVRELSFEAQLERKIQVKEGTIGADSGDGRDSVELSDMNTRIRRSSPQPPLISVPYSVL